MVKDRIRVFFLKTSGLFLLVLFVLTSCTGQPDITERKTELVEQVKKEFLHAWKSYKTYAWGHDALKPLSKSFRDWCGISLYMTPVDAFDTMLLMGLKDEADKAKKLVLDSLSFDYDIEVQGFEINIRLLGGLLTAYQMDGNERFLKLAKDLADRLLPIFDSPTGLPYVKVNLRSGEVSGKINNPAEIGTYTLEFGTLSRLTNNPVYFNKVKKAVTELYKRRSKIGLVGTTIDVETGEWVSKSSHISGMIDSYYEYLLKGSLLFQDDDLKNMWQESIVAVNKYLADEKESRLWYGHSNMESGKRTAPVFGALDAFFPAVLALGGDLERAEKLQTSCFYMWKKYGIEPESYNYETDTVISEYYILRPENIESAYYLYQYTKDKKYLEMGETYLNSLIKYCKTETGYCHLKSVISKEKQDAMESFFLAETLKYLYLLFAPDETLDFRNTIFNTEAHPLRLN